MPIYMRVDGIKGDVQPAGGSGGGVWKTSNFMTRDAAGSAPTARPKINVFICPSDPAVVPISRISLMQGTGGVEGHDPAAKSKVEQIINSARSRGPMGRLYIATDAGVYGAGGSRMDQQGRLLVGSDQGIWRSSNGQNNIRQLGIGMHNTTSVEIIIADTCGLIVGTHRLQNTTVSRHAGGVLVAFGDGSVR